MHQGQNELTVRETAQSLGVRLGTVYQLLWDGAISGRKDERNEWRVDAESVERYRLRRIVRQTATRTTMRRGAIDVTAAAVSS